MTSGEKNLKRDALILCNTNKYSLPGVRLQYFTIIIVIKSNNKDDPIDNSLQ